MINDIFLYYFVIVVVIVIIIVIIYYILRAWLHGELQPGLRFQPA